MIDIYGLFKKLPGGSLLFPMFTVAIINTIFPNLFTGLGGMTMAMYKTGTLTVAGIILFATGGAFNVMDIITVLVPFFLGMLLGNIDPNFGKMMAPASPILIPFMGACFGASINLVNAAKAGIAGIILAVLFLVLNVPIMLFTDKVVNRRPGYCAVAWCSVAGIAMSVPAMLATDEAFASYVADASAQIALCLIITSLVSPLITKWVVDKWGSPKVPAKKDRAAA